MGREQSKRSGGGGGPGQGSAQEGGGQDFRKMAMMQRAQARKKYVPPAEDPQAVAATAMAASQILGKAMGAPYKEGDFFAKAPPEVFGALIELSAAAALKGDSKADERFRLVDAALPVLEPILQAGKQSHDFDVQQAADGALFQMKQLRADSNSSSRASERVDNAVLVDDKQGKQDVVESKDLEGEMDKEKKEKLKELLPKVREDTKSILEGASDGVLKNDPLKGKLEAAIAMLDFYGAVADAPEFMEEAGGSDNGLAQARMSSEMVGKILEAVKGAMTLGMQVGTRLAKLAGNTELAVSFAKCAESMGEGFDVLLKGFSLLTDVLTLIPGSGSSTQDKVDAVVDVASTTAAWRMGKAAGGAAEESAAEGGMDAAGSKAAGELAEKAVGGAVGGSLMINYEMMKLFAASWMNTRMTFAGIGYEAGMGPMVQHMSDIEYALQKTEKATLLAEQEKDPDAKAALESLARQERLHVTDFIDQFLDDIDDPEYARHPMINDQLRILVPLRNRARPDGDLQALKLIEERMQWIAKHASEIVTDEAKSDRDAT